MPSHSNYLQAIQDFQNARRKAALKEVIARLTGDTAELLSFEEVRQKLRLGEGNQSQLKEIPLDAIVGSVGRYTDFTRDFLPRRDSDQARWVNVRTKVDGMAGLPPIKVYQIGEAYFVIDGNHRVSVARQLGATHIHAYVTQVRSRVPITPETQPDDLIIKAEQLNFYEHTRLDQLRPQADLTVTVPGQYPILEEHISVHRYFMAREQQRKVPFEEAVVHWYDEIYLPVVQIIRDRGILRHFPGRTETDLYLWISRHRLDLEHQLGWSIDTPEVIEDLVTHYSSDFREVLSHLTNRILDVVTPDSLESGPPVGHWRQEHVSSRKDDRLFKNILVTLDKDHNNWRAVEQALIIANREKATLHGLHVIPKGESSSHYPTNELETRFLKRCKAAGVPGEVAVERGVIARVICQRAMWSDLIISNLNHPPGDHPVQRLGSGFRTMVRRCSRPILAVPGQISELQHALLAFNNSPKAREALFISAYLQGKWGCQLTVLTINPDREAGKEIQEKARTYLSQKGLEAQYVHLETVVSGERILHTAYARQCDCILMGGYTAQPVIEVVIGSTVDQVLRQTRIPVLICR